jgi:hypothetical protein
MNITSLSVAIESRMPPLISGVVSVSSSGFFAGEELVHDEVLDFLHQFVGHVLAPETVRAGVKL